MCSRLTINTFLKSVWYCVEYIIKSIGKILENNTGWYKYTSILKMNNQYVLAS